MKFSIHQTSFLPWVGFWNKLLLSDMHISISGVSFDKSGYQNRTMCGNTLLTVPVADHPHGTLLKDIRLAENWGHARRKMVKSIRQEVMTKDNPHRDRLHNIIVVLEAHTTNWLVELNRNLMYRVLTALGEGDRDVAFSGGVYTGSKVGNLETLIKTACPLRSEQAKDTYLSGSGAKDYMDKDSLPGIEVLFQEKVLDTRSILQVLADEDEPAEVIRKAAVWD